jgi:hypothetical protein
MAKGREEHHYSPDAGQGHHQRGQIANGMSDYGKFSLNMECNINEEKPIAW